MGKLAFIFPGEGSQYTGMFADLAPCFEEVQHWLSMSPVEKRITWRRITQQATAWRFGRYADRALERK